jgi:hypothetical protein
MISYWKIFLQMLRYQKSPTAILDRRNKLYLGCIEFRFAEELGACENAMQWASKLVYDYQQRTFRTWDIVIRDMLLMKSDFILLDVSASRRLISTIKEFVNAERYEISESTVKTGTADSLHTKQPA